MAKIEPIKNKRGEVIHPITDTQAVEGLAEELAYKQETLVSGKNIKKINGESILGNGNLIIGGGGGGAPITIDSELSLESENPVQNKTITQALNNKQDELESGINIKTVNGESIVGSGDIHIQEGDPSAVKFAPQELTVEQMEQARRNINAASIADLETTEFVVVETLPEPSSVTVGYIFLVGPDASNNYNRFFTQEDGESYSWISLGSTQIDLSNYATNTRVNQLEARLDALAHTRYYGIFTSAEDLPEDASEEGYAYVGVYTPFAIYEFDGEDWVDTGAIINAVQGESGQDGIGLYSVTSQEDGTVLITLTNGDTITLDLNHNHDAYYSKLVGTAQPSGGFLPDVAYNLGEISGTVTFALSSAVAGQLNHYFWIFSTGGTAPTITWPAVTWAAGSAPIISTNKKYEISILNGVAYYSEA